MNASRWQRIETLFAAAIDLAETERSAYLERHCGEDVELRLEVEELLAMDQAEEGARLHDAIRSEAQTLVEAAEDSLIGRRLGPWQVRERIGQGGMSTVYRAERVDPQFRQRVALKVLQGGMNADEILRRFHNERQILASLDHPSIARLIDAGRTREGLSYFVMEHVVGEPLDVYCDRQRLRVADRLALFRSVCEAVAYAHRNLVVHRDLKPSNILVTPEGDVKLLDFGIAKPLAPERLGGRIEPTIGPMRLMTPSYASPELIAGRPVTTASDVYSLGVLLYLLLCGLRPFDFAGKRLGEIEHLILEVEPEPPSGGLKRRAREGDPEVLAVAGRRSTDLKSLTRQLEGDLDTLVLQAMRKAPERRYASVEHLMDDLDRFRTGHPLAARPESFPYVAGKLLGRHRWAAVGIAAALLLVTGFVTALTLLAIELNRQRQVAESQRQVAEDATEFLVSIFEVAEPEQARGEAVSAVAILEAGAQRARQELAAEPELQAKLLHALGQVHQKLGLYAQAEPLLRQALTLRLQVLGPSHPEAAASLNRLAILSAQQGDLESAERLFRQVLDIRRAIYGREHADVAASLNNLALLLHERASSNPPPSSIRKVLPWKTASAPRRPGCQPSPISPCCCWISTTSPPRKRSIGGPSRRLDKPMVIAIPRSPDC